MASKRTSYDDDDSTKNLHVPSTKRIRHHDGNPEQQHPLFPTMSLLSAINDKNIVGFYLERSIRKVTREVLDHSLAQSSGLTINRRVNPNGRGSLQLCFMNNLAQRNFTDTKIEAEGKEPLRIELRDAENHNIVRDVGSSMKIEICVLHGDFRKEDWTAEEFDKQIVIPREGKGPLLKGDTIITLKDGVAFINNLEFTDIIKGRTKEARLGAKIVRSNSIGLDIREGRSEPFRVWHHRVKAYKKHDRASMNDEVSRLRGIGGKRRDKLALHGIVSVKDFLQLHKTNEASLREKMGKIAKKSWNKIIAHVKECDVNDEEEERVKQHAYKNLNGLKQMAIDTTTHGLVETSTGLQTAQYGGQDQTLQEFDFPIPPQGLPYTDPTSFNQSFAYQPEMWPSTSISQSDIGSEFYNQMLAMGEVPPYNFSEAYNFDGASQISQFGSYSLEQVNANTFPFVYGDGAGPSNHSSSLNFAVHISSNVKPKKDWQKIRSAVKWFMLYVTKREQIVFICTP